jgi:streptogramin lyase
MNKLMIAASAAALLTASSLAALAAEASGAIASVDASSGTVTLDSGQTFTLPSGLDAASLQPGQQVTITYEESSDGQMTATEVAPAM